MKKLFIASFFLCSFFTVSFGNVENNPNEFVTFTTIENRMETNDTYQDDSQVFENDFYNQFEIRKFKDISLPVFLFSNLYSLKMLLNIIPKTEGAKFREAYNNILLILANMLSEKSNKKDIDVNKRGQFIRLGKLSKFINQIKSMTLSYNKSFKKGKGSLINKIKRVAENLKEPDGMGEPPIAGCFNGYEEVEKLIKIINTLEDEGRIWDEESQDMVRVIQNKNDTKITEIIALVNNLKKIIDECRRELNKEEIPTFSGLYELYKEIVSKIKKISALQKIFAKLDYNDLFIKINKEELQGLYQYLDEVDEKEVAKIKEEMLQEVFKQMGNVRKIPSKKEEEEVREVIEGKIICIYKNPFLLFGDRELNEDALNEYKLSIEVAFQALQALTNGDLEKLDPAGGDNACQVRAAKTLDLYKKKDYIKIIRDDLKRYKKQLEEFYCSKKIDKTVKYKCLTISLFTYLKNNNIFFELDDDLKYLACCYLRSFSTNEMGIKSLLRKYNQRGTTEQTRMLRNFLMDYAIEYLQSSVQNAGKNFFGSLNKNKFINEIIYRADLIEVLQQVKGTNGKRSCPNFFGVLVLLYQELIKGRPICVKITKIFPEGKVNDYLFYKPTINKTKFELVDNLDFIQDDDPIMVFDGWSFDGSFIEFCKTLLCEDDNYKYNDSRDYGRIKKAIKGYNVLSKEKKLNIKNLDIINDIILPNEAQHKQYPGKKDKEINFTRLSNISLKNLYFKCLEKSQYGTSRNNMNIFLIDHIYPATKKMLNLGGCDKSRSKIVSGKNKKPKNKKGYLWTIQKGNRWDCVVYPGNRLDIFDRKTRQYYTMSFPVSIEMLDIKENTTRGELMLCVLYGNILDTYNLNDQNYLIQRREVMCFNKIK